MSQVDSRGQLTGDNIIYLYPGLDICLVGRFQVDRTLVLYQPLCVLIIIISTNPEAQNKKPDIVKNIRRLSAQ
jgi:hypothetical protein